MVFLIEDDPRTSTALQSYLQAAGYHTRVFETGEHACAAAGDLSPAVAICDWKLKGAMDGLAVARSLKHSLPGAAIIMMTARPLEHLMADAGDLDVTAYLAKPVALKEFSQLIEAHLRRC